MNSIEPLRVELAERGYPIVFHEVFEELQLALDESFCGRSSVAAILDRALVGTEFAHWLRQRLGGRLWIPDVNGESLKSLSNLEAIHNFLAGTGVDRGGLLTVVGGGVVGDLGGFAAATYLRGIDMVQVPTTLLAMVDSSVGGKTGVNIEAGKNLVGAFHQPRQVHVCGHFLTTLERRELAAGWAEVVKYGLLADADLLSELEGFDQLDHPLPDLRAIIRRCCEIKAGVVRADERETAADGGRALLNLGHTFAHAIEKVAGFGAYLHGEAVAIGLVLAARLSQRQGLLADTSLEERTVNLLRRQGLPVALKQPLSIDDLLVAMGRDKKVRAGRLRFVLLEAPGRAVTVDCVGEAAVQAVWRTAGAT